MGPLFSSLIISFGSADVIDRSTHYFIDNVYEFGGARYVGIFPTTLIALLFTYIYDKKTLESYGAKCLLFAVTFYNIFNSVPLLGRSLNALFLLGVILGIPYIVSRKQRSVFRAVMCVVAAGLMYTTVRNYNLGTDTNGGTYNLAMVSKWDIADYGTTSLLTNFNSKERPTVQLPGVSGEDAEKIAFLSQF